MLWYDDLRVGVIVVIVALFLVRELVITIPDLINPITRRSQDEADMN